MSGKIVRTTQGPSAGVGAKTGGADTRAIAPKPMTSTYGFGPGDIYNRPGASKGILMPKSIPHVDRSGRK